jgi:hypothetical protein
LEILRMAKASATTSAATKAADAVKEVVEETVDTPPTEPNVEEKVSEEPTVEASEESDDEEMELTSATKPNFGDGKPPEFLWITEGENEVRVTVYAYKDEETGRLRSLTTEPSLALRALGMIEYPIESTWTIPTKAQLETYKREASLFDRSLMRTLVDRSAIQTAVIEIHLRELKVHVPAAEGSEPQLIQLTRDKRGKLTKVTMKLLQSMHPSAQELMFTKFVEDASLLL